MQTATVSREIHLAARPRGVPGPDSFSWDAFLGLYRGDNIGKMAVRLGDAR